MSDFLSKALPLLLKSIPCFPCYANKMPMTPNGFKAATTDLDQIERWNLMNPQAIPAVPTGEASGLFVLDVDGDVPLPGALPVTQINHTRRGRHYLFKTNGVRLRSTAGVLGEKLDTRGTGGYVIWWPAEGFPVENEGTLAEVPIWLFERTVEQVVEKPIPPAEGRTIDLGEDAVPATWSEVVSAVRSIDPDCGRDDWVRVGMAIHKIDADQRGYDLWNSWSSKSAAKYNATEMPSQWKSFKDTHPNPVTVGTLFKLAYNAGWTRPSPDVSGMFSPVGEQSAKAVATKLLPSLAAPASDLDLWPDVLRLRALEIAAEVGCDPVVPLMAGLAAVSAAADKRSKLKINDSWTVSPTIWLMTIGEPSDKKTPGSRPMFSVLRELEFEDNARYEAAMLGWIGKEARYASQMKVWREWQQSPESEFPNCVPPKIDPLPPEPKTLRMLVQDATSQKLVGMSVGRERGFLLYLDEMNRWLQKLSDPKNPDDRGCWIQGFETGPYTMDRVGAGTIHTDNLAMSIYGNCQPSVFRKTAVGASHDGIIQRFLPVTIDARHNVMWKDAVPSFMSAKAGYDATIRRIFTVAPTEYELSPQAKALFRQHCEWALEIRRMERTIGSNETYQTALGKLEGQTARLILLFHMMVDPLSVQISESTVRSSIDLAETFFYPSLRHVFMELLNADPLPRIVFDYVLEQSGVKSTVTLADIRRVARDQLEKDGRLNSYGDQLLHVVMEELAANGHVALFQNQIKNPMWTINPALATYYADKRREILKAKRKIAETTTRKNARQ